MSDDVERLAEGWLDGARARLDRAELGAKVDPECDVVAVDGTVVTLAEKPVYLALYKPAGVVTTMSDPQGRTTVADLVPVKPHPGLFPVGRLDYETTGLLLFTTDGDWQNESISSPHQVL